MNNWKDWLGGIISAISGGMSGAFGASLADPSDFNLWSAEGRRRILTIALFSGLPALLGYLKRRPLPGVEGEK